jgi:hypothetical protein
MKTLLALMIFLGSTAYAEDKVYEFKDADVASVQIKVVNVGEPANEPLRMTIEVLCVDKRSHPNSIKPSWETVLANEPICDYRPRKGQLNTQTKVLTLHYSISEYVPGQAKCNGHFKQPLSLLTQCAPWQR